MAGKYRVGRVASYSSNCAIDVFMVMAPFQASRACRNLRVLAGVPQVLLKAMRSPVLNNCERKGNFRDSNGVI